MSELALLGGEPAVSSSFPHWPQSTDLEAHLLKDTLDSGTWWRMTGTQIKIFERDFAAFHGVPYGLAVTNGTHALELALRTLDIGPGDEVIIPSMTFIATAMAVFSVGACPVAVDVLPDTWCLDLEAVRSKISPRTKAVIPVHFAGHVVDMKGLETLCSSHGIAIIEDAAHAHGAVWGGQSAGSFGVMSAFSFQNFKLLTAGEGGMLLATDEDIYNKAVLIANCGRPPGDTSYEHSILGSNYRMSEFQAAVLNAQLTRLNEWGKQRERIANYLNNLMCSVDGIKPQGRDSLVDRHAYYMYVFRYDPTAFSGLKRETFVEALVAEGVPAFRMYPAVQDTTFYESALAKVNGNLNELPDCPVSRQIAKSGVWIHHRVLLADENTAGQVVDAIEKIRRNASKLTENQPVAVAI